MTDICMGKPTAYFGHKVHCPKCKGDYPIVEGVLTTSFYGKGVALAGMKTSCGAVLIASQFTDTVEWSNGGSAASGVSTAPATSSPTSVRPDRQRPSAESADNGSSDKRFDEQYALLDEDDRPLADFPYTVKLQSGAFEPGITDAQGRTKRYVTDGANPIEVYLGHREA